MLLQEFDMNSFIKRIIDVVLSGIAILLFLPFWFVIVVLIKLDSKGPILYKHRRVGKAAKEFDCLKFRSMHVGSNEMAFVNDSADKRLTKIGLFLRRLSLDETPQLLNVFLGHMSIVGPRPALPSQVKEFTEDEHDKLLVKPGLTGWTQINGRNSISYKKRMELDCWYAKNWNILLDLKIILKTPFALFRQEGIYNVK